MQSNSSNGVTVGIVVPTLGLRLDYLLDCLRSIRAIEATYTLLVAPVRIHPTLNQHSHLFDQLVADPGTGLAAAINEGVEKLPAQIQIFNWLGDDDLLTKVGIIKSVAELQGSPNCVATFGISKFIDANGKVFSQSTLGKHAVTLLLTGPNKIPQPGALIRRTQFKKIGGLNTNLGWAFDYDMFIRLSRLGEIRFVAEEVSKYRWHPNSLSASQTHRSIFEASKVRKENLPTHLRKFAFLWETPHVGLALLLSRRLTKLARRKSKIQDKK